MKNKNVFLALVLALSSLVLNVEARAGVGKYITSSGYVMSWDKKKVVLLSDGYYVHVPRKAFGKTHLKRGHYVSRISYELTKAPGYKKMIKQFKKATVRHPAALK